MVIRKYKITSVKNIPGIKEELKQKMQVKAQRGRQFDKRNIFYKENKIFQTDAKKFYTEIWKKKTNYGKRNSTKGQYRKVL